MLPAIQRWDCLRFASKWLSDAGDHGPRSDGPLLMCHEEQMGEGHGGTLALG